MYVLSPNFRHLVFTCRKLAIYYVVNYLLSFIGSSSGVCEEYHAFKGSLYVNINVSHSNIVISQLFNHN